MELDITPVLPVIPISPNAREELAECLDELQQLLNCCPELSSKEWRQVVKKVVVMRRLALERIPV